MGENEKSAGVVVDVVADSAHRNLERLETSVRAYVRASVCECVCEREIVTRRQRRE